MVKHTQTIRQQIADKLFECLTILWNWRLKVLSYMLLTAILAITKC